MKIRGRLIKTLYQIGWLAPVVLAVFQAGLAVGVRLQRRAGEVRADAKTLAPLREISHTYRFISPLLAVGDAEELHDFAALEREVGDRIRDTTAAGQASTISVYFRDLNSSRWMGVNADERFAPASLYKVATMIAYLKTAETRPEILTTSVIYDPANSPSRPEDDATVSTIVPGKPYTVTQLITHMIVASDNDAAALLIHGLNRNLMAEVFGNLGLALPADGDLGDTMSAKSYSLFFRILYNASYLGRSTSEQALELLSQTTFRDGLEAGVPAGVTVSHKFGHRVLPNGEELHDCGIIYAPQKPYLLCIMTRGDTIAGLTQSIRDISRLIYGMMVEPAQP